MEPAEEVLEKVFRMLRLSSGLVHPHIGIAFEVWPGSFSTCRVVIPVQYGFLAQALVQFIIHRPPPSVRGLQDPVGHGLPGQLQPLPLKLLLQTVQRRAHDKFPGHDVGYCLWGGNASRAECGLSGGLPQISPCLCLTRFVGVGVVYILLDLEPDRIHLQARWTFLPISSITESQTS